jgi:hypothetical protein
MTPAEAIRRADEARAKGREHAAKHWVRKYREERKVVERIGGEA